MPSKKCLVGPHRMAGFFQKLKKPFPLMEKDPNTELHLHGQGDGISFLSQTIFHLLTDRERNQSEFLTPYVHPFDAEADGRLDKLYLMDDVALGQLVTDPAQEFLEELYARFRIVSVHTMRKVADNEDVIETIGAVRSGATNIWILQNFQFNEDGMINKLPPPWILTFIPPTADPAEEVSGE